MFGTPKVTVPMLFGFALALGCSQVGMHNRDKTDRGQWMQSSPGDFSRTIRVGQVDRRYKIHVPPGYDGGTTMPVVIMLHGGGGTGRSAIYETGWDQKADKSGFLAVFPEALPPDPERPGHFRWNPQLWNDGSDRFYPGQCPPDDLAFFDAMLNDIASMYQIDENRIFVTGFSNGASMAFRLGAERSRRVAAIAPVAGTLWLDRVSLEQPVSMIYITGTADPLNLMEGGVPRLANGRTELVRAKAKPPVRDSILKWCKALGCDVAVTEPNEGDGVRTEVFGGCKEGAEVVFIAVEGLGHTWAGGKSLLPESLVGKRSDRINATDVIWDFFCDHPMRL